MCTNKSHVLLQCKNTQLEHDERVYDARHQSVRKFNRIRDQGRYPYRVNNFIPRFTYQNADVLLVNY